MKNSILVFALLFVGFFISCSSDSDDDTDMNTPPIDTEVTYTNTIKSIISSNCTSCHGSPTSNSAPMSLTTASLVESAINTRGLISKVENGTMPPNGTLSASQIKALKDWQAGGFK